MAELINRSQAILRMPVDMVSATVLLHDGERSDVMLFVPTGEGIVRMLRETAPFVPVVRKGRTCLVGRGALVAIAIPKAAIDEDAALPVEEQKVLVKLRSGIELVGSLSWCPAGQHRTKDYLNDDEIFFELHVGELTYFIVKAQVTTVQEC